MKRPLISVIMPAYNSEKTVASSIESVLNQTYDNLELIVINDGSKDNTEQIVRFYTEQDKRVKLITVTNGGVSKARNIGIDNAVGEYIGFIDSDDTIECDMYELLVNLAEKYGVEIAHCSYKNVSETGEVISFVGDGSKEYVLNHDEALIALLSGHLFAGGLCNKLYQSGLFKETRLKEGIKINEDVLMNFHLFDKVSSSVYINKPCYNYVANNDSATHTANSVKSGEDGMNVNKEILATSINTSYENVARYRYAVSLLGVYRGYIFEKMLSTDKAKKIKKEITELYDTRVYSSVKDRTLVRIYKYLPGLFRFMYKFYDKIRVKKLDPTQ